MDERDNKFGQLDSELDREMAKGKETTDPETGSSYYYSYGPFQSINKDSMMKSEISSYDGGSREDVEVTPPQPLRTLPTVNEFNSSRSDHSGGNSNNSSGGNGNWQFNQKPKSSVKTILVSFLAGMVVISSLMFTADRMNLFTPDTPLAAVAPVESNAVATSNNNSESSNATTTLLPLTNQGDVSTVYKVASPAVVKIATFVKSGSVTQTNPYSSDPFSYFFGDQFGGSSRNNGDGSSTDSQSQTDEDQLVAYGIGSGFIYDEAGYILTNQHVINSADVIQVTLEGNSKPYEAKLLGSSEDLDLAVLKIEGDTSFPILPLGDSDAATVGEEVVAIGNPQGFDHTVTSGVLSAKERSIDIAAEDGSGTNTYKHLLQTDASINSGNSGGPLLNLNGEVIGMNVAVSADAQGIGFAIPTSVIKEVVEQLESNQEIPKEPIPFIGASLITMTDEVANQMGTDLKEGSLVAEVIYKSPAYLADIRPYDIIAGINGTDYVASQDLIDFIQTQEINTEITLNIVRDGKAMDLPVTIGNRNDFETSSNQ
ncbi:S1C family serine protease [Paenibacillus crassostreae]|uniref:Serine protease n=1 Tax=Paenibacillus crassostreae TaxID=1763538 RepID=A0A167GT25_9BACL|nr:trypsin-like peptidase domain-containing protein [Paenibacillus crassostreae]AOZ92063.1 serine protease [Paenibacillus crassostreae]OAB77872.1 serine protease [Paenibacillus crassostreae]